MPKSFEVTMEFAEAGPKSKQLAVTMTAAADTLETPTAIKSGYTVSINKTPRPTGRRNKDVNELTNQVGRWQKRIRTMDIVKRLGANLNEGFGSANLIQVVSQTGNNHNLQNQVRLELKKTGS